jgi:hypothetical protein
MARPVQGLALSSRSSHISSSSLLSPPCLKQQYLY